MTHKIKNSNSSSGTKKCSSCRFVIDLGLESDSLMHEMIRLWWFNFLLFGQLFSFPKFHENFVRCETWKSANLRFYAAKYQPVLSCCRWLKPASMQRIEWWHLISQQPKSASLDIFNGEMILSWMKFFGTISDNWRQYLVLYEYL